MKKGYLLLILGFLLAFSLASREVLGYYGTTIPWTMYRHDLARSGFTSSTAPSNNATLWSSTFTYGIFPLVTDGMVVVTDSYNLYAVDETTGVRIWGPVSLSNPVYSSPAIVGDRIYIPAGGYLYCYNTTNGAKLWEHFATGTGTIQTSPAVANGKVFYGTTDGHVDALDATTGLFAWQYAPPGMVIYYSSPTIDRDLLFFGADDYRIRALNISGATPSPKWTLSTAGQIRATPTVADGKVFVGTSYTDHALFAIDEATGTLLWAYMLSYVAVNAPAASAYGLVFFTASNKAYALRMNATVGINYTDPDYNILLWSQTMSSYSLSGPVVADGKVFIGGNDGSLYALNATTGAFLWTSKFASGVGEPLIADGRVFAPSSNTLYCIGDPFPPLAYDFTVTPYPGYNYIVQLETNSTPTPLQIDISGLITLKKLNFTIQGISGTTGMSNITIPKDLLDGTMTVTVDGISPNYGPIIVDNGTHTSLYFTYSHSPPHSIVVTGTTVIPEFSTATFLAFLTTSSLVAIAIAKRKLPRN